MRQIVAVIAGLGALVVAPAALAFQAAQPPAAPAPAAAPAAPAQPPLPPPDPARLAAARDLFEATNMRQILRSTFAPQVEQTLAATLRALVDSPAAAAARQRDPYYDERARRVSRVYAQEMSGFVDQTLPAMLDALAADYARTFTLEELRAQTDFYRSPVGRSVAAKTPDLQMRQSGSMASVMQARMGERAAIIQERVRQVTADLPPPPAATGSAPAQPRPNAPQPRRQGS
jgi:hypothetical protein